MSNTWIQEKPGLALAEDLKFNSTVGPPALKKFREVTSAFKSPFVEELISAAITDGDGNTLGHTVPVIEIDDSNWGAAL